MLEFESIGRGMVRWAWAGAAMMLCATATNAAADQMNIVAHQDDDLLLINPAIAEAIASGEPVHTVFLTAGNASWDCAAYAFDRESGMLLAYEDMVSAIDPWPQTWVHSTATVNGQGVTRAELPFHDVTLTFLHLQNVVNVFGPGESPVNDGTSTAHDGDIGELWHNQVPSISTLTMGVPATDGETYTRETLINTLVALLAADSPDEVNLLDASETADFEHPDHVHTALFGLAAVARWGGTADVSLHKGDGILFDSGNLTPAQTAAKSSAFEAYEPMDAFICNNGGMVLSDYNGTCAPQSAACLDSSVYDLGKDVTVPYPNLTAFNQQIGSPSFSCLVADSSSHGATVRAGSCMFSPIDRFHINLDGTIKAAVGGRCMDSSGGTLHLANCNGGTAQEFRLFDNGQLRAAEALCADVSSWGQPVQLRACQVEREVNQWGFWPL